MQQPHKLLSEAGCGDPTAGDFFGPAVVIESAHPYKNNTLEYTAVHIHGAISYTIRFDDATRTEPIHDYVKFFADDRHTEYYGCGKYSGGMKVSGSSSYSTTGTLIAAGENGKSTACNWPGQGDRPLLIIPASRFVVCFRTNGSVTDWGFKLYATPLISKSTAVVSNSTGFDSARGDGHPVISDRGKLYRNSNVGTVATSGSTATKSGNVYDRLHNEAMVKSVAIHNQHVSSCRWFCDR